MARTENPTKTPMKSVTAGLPQHHAEALADAKWDLRQEPADMLREAVSDWLTKKGLIDPKTGERVVKDAAAPTA